jgi:hypothetical protein
MKLKLLLPLALISTCILFGCSTALESPRQYLVSHQSGERPDVLTYSKPTAKTKRQIEVESVSLTEEQLRRLNALSRSGTENGVRWLVEEKPDTMRSGPWITQLYIFDQAVTNLCIRVALVDDHGRVDHTWLNDKMLFVRVWFGRIAWTDFVLDTETRRFVYIENGRLEATLDAEGK